MTDIRKPMEEATVRGKAVFSPDRRYRYSMYRSWGEEAYGSKEWYERTLCFVLGNPSYADALICDTTTMNCLRIAADPAVVDFGGVQSNFDGMIIFNLLAEISSHSKDLSDEHDPAEDAEEHENEKYLEEVAKYSTIIAGWGGIKGSMSSEKKKRIQLLHRWLQHKQIYSVFDSEREVSSKYQEITDDEMPRHLSLINLKEQESANKSSNVKLYKWCFPDGF